MFYYVANDMLPAHPREKIDIYVDNVGALKEKGEDGDGGDGDGGDGEAAAFSDEELYGADGGKGDAKALEDDGDLIMGGGTAPRSREVLTDQIGRMNEVIRGLTGKDYCEENEEGEEGEKGKKVEEEGGEKEPPLPLSASVSLSSSTKISYTSFATGDTVLFMPIGVVVGTKTFLAFNVNCPNHYLNTGHGVADCNKRDFVIGRIVMKEEAESKGGKEEFGVPKGSKFWMLTCEVLN